MHIPSLSIIIILVEFTCSCSEGLSGCRISKVNSSGDSKAILSSVMKKLVHTEERVGGKTTTRSIASACIPVHR